MSAYNEIFVDFNDFEFVVRHFFGEKWTKLDRDCDVVPAVF